MKPPPSKVRANTPPRRQGLMRLSMRAKSNLDGYLFISPWLIGFLLLVTYPLLFSLWLSFRDITNLRLLETTFVGIDNYKDAFVVDVDFGPLILENLGNLLMDLPIIMVFSLGMALLVSQPLFGRTFFRAVLFMPVVIGSAFVITQLAGQGVGAQTIVRDSSDLENALAVYVGEGGLEPLTILVNRIVFVLWRSGVQILIFVAGLHSIPQHFYEAARVDGASNWGIFWKITLPLLSPFILVNIIYTIVDSFTEPFNTTLDYIQEKALTGEFELHYGAALGMIYFLIIFAILGIVLLWSRRLVHYIGER
jgi:ABC-type sugar transport system permease subunit